MDHFKGGRPAPIGAEGDLMVRKLVRRLVDVDLLDQAAQLLKYQAENRLDGVPKAQVSTDLAVIYLMDRKPEQAIAKIVEGRIGGFYKDICLLEQPYAKDDKQSVTQFIGSAKIVKFAQVEIG